MIFPRHPRAELARAAEGRLDPAARRRLEDHLGRCARCRRELAAAAAAAAALRETVPSLPPAHLRDRLLAAAIAERAANPDVTRGATRRWALAGAAALALAGAAAVALLPARVRVVSPPTATSAFERQAIAAHGALRGASPALDLASGEAAAVRAWLQRRQLSASLVDERPAAESARYRLLGASDVGTDARPSAAIATRIDGAPVTLLVGREGDVEGIPAWGWFGKQLLVRRDPATGTHLMSWRNAGKAYTLVTEPGVRAEVACQLCHVDERRRRAIARIAEQL
ncbi:MAG: hypothetical protein NDJ75_06150 [Thermoanaerobaculia bacterium]|nr:hypothetical protein [Thermoanaerobaculia bacterium]